MKSLLKRTKFILLALLELKIALIKLISTYEIESTENTPKNLEFNEGIVRTPKDGINVILRKRQ
jgi:hypothetical protein